MPEKFEKKKVVFNSCPLKSSKHKRFGGIVRDWVRARKAVYIILGQDLGNSRENFFACLLQGTQPPLTPRRGLYYRGRVPDASP